MAGGPCEDGEEGGRGAGEGNGDKRKGEAGRYEESSEGVGIKSWRKIGLDRRMDIMDELPRCTFVSLKVAAYDMEEDVIPRFV